MVLADGFCILKFLDSHRTGPNLYLRFSKPIFHFPGDYTCSVQNAHGSDQIIYEIIVQIPPMAPQLSVRNLTFTEVELFWTDSRSRKQPVLGYKLFYRYVYILALFKGIINLT